MLAKLSVIVNSDEKSILSFFAGIDTMTKEECSIGERNHRMSTELVQEGFRQIADRFAEDRSPFDNRRELVEFSRFLPKHAEVLDVGCGVGIPAAKYLVDEGCRVTGVDIAEPMLEIAKKNVPQATFLTGDMTQLHFPDGSFDGIVSLHAIHHVPREQHEEIFRSFHRILKHQGVLMISSATDEFEGTKEHYGVPMFWSHFSPEQTVDLLRTAKFNIVSDYHVESHGKLHYWIIAKNW